MTKVFAVMVALVVLAGCERTGADLCLQQCGIRGVRKYTNSGFSTPMVCECGNYDDGCPAQDGGSK